MQYKKNIFTQIINKEVDVNYVIDNKYTIVIKDINPQQKIHMLIIPKNYYINYYDFCKNATILEKDDFNNTYLQLIEKYNIQNNHKIQLNVGELSSQEIMHMHMHILSN